MSERRRERLARDGQAGTPRSRMRSERPSNRVTTTAICNANYGSVETHRMTRVSLVCTVHEESGCASVAELRAILEHIQPEVIFLEVPPAAFKDYFENSQNLEAKAVRQYRAGHQVELVPVDLPTPTGEFFSNFEELRRRIRLVSPNYRRLMQWDGDCIREYGFVYLNSEECSQLWLSVYKEMLSTIEWLKDSSLLAPYESWIETNNLRENAWIENIQKYCGDKTCDKGAFLVGAAHRQPIIEKSRKQTAPGSTRIQWDFTDWMGQVPRVSGA
jgi:hypothetical protein